MKLISILMAASSFLIFTTGVGQEIGANFNHNPEIIDFKYLEKSNVDWVRSTPRILDFITGKLTLENDPGLEKMKQAGEKGYNIAFGFRLDFKNHNMKIPRPSSAEEQELFETVALVLEKFGPYIDIFKLGNEPNLETLPEDMKMNPEGYIPLVNFTERLLEQVVLPFYRQHEEFKVPDIYVGSFPRLFMKEEQDKEGIKAMIQLAHNHPQIKGLAVHLHISDSAQIDESFKFVRSLMPQKPIIVPEFSFHRLYTKRLDDSINKTKEGKNFLKEYNRNSNWKLHDWFGYANSNMVSREEWKDLFETLEWFPHNNLLTYYDRFEKYGVVLATYPLFQQSAPKKMNPNSPAWFINPIFAQKSLNKQANGDYSTNPLHYDDFLTIVEKGKAKSQNKKTQ